MSLPVPVRRRRVIVALVVVLAVLAALWVIIEQDERTSIVFDDLSPELEPYADEIEQVVRLQASDPEQAARLADEIIEKLPAGTASKWLDYAVNAGIEDIRFFGRVVDQFGNPLAGAKVSYEAAGKFYGAGSGRGSVTTDGGGNFSIAARGGSLTIWNIEYPNAMYSALTQGKPGISKMYSKGNDFWSYTRYQGSGNLNWLDYSPANPLLFDVWVVDPREASRQAANIRWAKGSVHLETDGQPQTLRIDTRRKRIEVLPGVDASGDFVVSCLREPMTNPADFSDWRFRLEPVNGGILSAPDRYLNLAPPSGYQPAISLGFEEGAADFRQNLFNQRLYFTSQGGERVGALMLGIQPFGATFNYATETYDEQYCQLVLEYKINTAGSRYLFKDRNLLPRG